ncbi:MAG: PASTA domain-containing protein [Candidatus Wallbacteria bacterium]|nr:PASTA domain-containing protein [Candidatus Wallbacteria bacterium]
MGRLLKLLLLLFILGLLTLLGIAHAKRALDTYFNRGSVVTPSVVGKTLEEAVETSTLTVKIASRVQSNDAPAGHIVAQDPAPGTPVHTAKPLLVVLSAGANMVDVPVVAGQLLRKAKLMLSDARLGSGQVCSMTSDKPRDTVLAQYPAPPGKLGRGGLVDLLVSVGAPTGPVPLPRVIGTTEIQARAIMARFGFDQIDVTVRPGPPDAPAGNVLDQEPAPGVAVATSARIQLVLAGNPPSSLPGSPDATGTAQTATRRMTASFTMPPGLTPKRLDVYLSEDGLRRHAIYSRQHEPSEKVAIPVEGTGTLELEFFVDNVSYGRQQL